MKGKTILLVEDNLLVMRNNQNMLHELGVKVFTAETAAKARCYLESIFFDAAIIDITLPDGSGLDLVKEIRSSGKSASSGRRLANLPILLLTAKNQTEDILGGFASGADDYLAKPYQLTILSARLEALLRRSGLQNKPSIVDHSVTIGFLRFDALSQQAFYDGKDLLLTQKEYSLLFFLAQNRGTIIPPKQLYEKVWGLPYKEKSAALRIQMSNLKKKLAEVSADGILETVWGGGYCAEIEKNHEKNCKEFNTL